MPALCASGSGAAGARQGLCTSRSLVLMCCSQQEYYRFERVLKKQLNTFAKQVLTKVMEDKDDTVTPEKISEFNVAFYNIPEQLKLRDLKTDRIGGLSRITGLPSLLVPISQTLDPTF